MVIRSLAGDCIVDCVVISFLKSSIISDLLLLAVIRAPKMDTLKTPLATERATLDDVSMWEWSVQHMMKEVKQLNGSPPIRGSQLASCGLPVWNFLFL
jgi:hypothetical protein